MADTKPRRLWEEEMLAEYLVKFHPQDKVLHRVRLGPIENPFPDRSLTEEEARMVGAAWRRWADAVVVSLGTLTVIEAAMIPDPGDISRLQTYLLLVPLTPELHFARDYVKRGLLVWAVEDRFSQQVAVKAGFEVRIFKPSNWLDYMTTRRARERGAPRTPVTVVP